MGIGCTFQRRKQSNGEREVREVIDGKGRLKSILGRNRFVQDGTCVEKKDIEWKLIL